MKRLRAQPLRFHVKPFGVKRLQLASFKMKRLRTPQLWIID